jgi:hypothetical protein
MGHRQRQLQQSVYAWLAAATAVAIAALVLGAVAVGRPSSAATAITGVDGVVVANGSVVAHNQTQILLTVPRTDPGANNILLTAVYAGPGGSPQSAGTFGVGSPGAMAQGYNATTGTFQFVNAGLYQFAVDGFVINPGSNPLPVTYSLEINASPTPTLGGLFYDLYGCGGQYAWPASGAQSATVCTPMLQVGPLQDVPVGWYLVVSMQLNCAPSPCTHNATFVVSVDVQQLM